MSSSIQFAALLCLVAAPEGAPTPSKFTTTKPQDAAEAGTKPFELTVRSQRLRCTTMSDGIELSARGDTPAQSFTVRFNGPLQCGCLSSKIDVNKDGHPEAVACASPKDDATGQGRVIVLYGSRAGFTATRSSVLERPEGFPGRFGTSARLVDDENGDGFPDLVVSSPFGERAIEALYLGIKNGVDPFPSATRASVFSPWSWAPGARVCPEPVLASKDQLGLEKRVAVSIKRCADALRDAIGATAGEEVDVTVPIRVGPHGGYTLEPASALIGSPKQTGYRGTPDLRKVCELTLRGLGLKDPAERPVGADCVHQIAVRLPPK